MKRGSDAVADKEERARFCDSGLRAKEARNTTNKTYWNPRPRRGPGLEPRRGQKRESTQHLPDLEEEVVNAVPVKSGSAPILGGSSSSADNLVNSSVATNVSVEDMVQTSVHISTSVGIQPVQLWYSWTLLQ